MKGGKNRSSALSVVLDIIGLRRNTTTGIRPIRLPADQFAGAGAQNRENSQLVHLPPSTFYRQSDRTMIRVSAFAHKPVFVAEPSGYSRRKDSLQPLTENSGFQPEVFQE